jgi:uncharacterized protein YhfF
LVAVTDFPDKLCEFALPGPLRDRLVAAVLSGAKTATSSLLAEWEADDDPLPTVGERQTVVDSQERPVAIIEITAVETIRLGDADDRLAHEEGEGFAGVAEWRAAHEEFWNEVVRREVPAAFPLTDDTPIFVERLRVVYNPGR